MYHKLTYFYYTLNTHTTHYNKFFHLLMYNLFIDIGQKPKNNIGK